MKSVADIWKELFSSKKKILKILEEIRQLEDADRVVIYTLGNNTSISYTLNKSVLYEVTRDRDTEKVIDLYSERLLDEEDFNLINSLLVNEKVVVSMKDISPESVMNWNTLKIKNREIRSICINRKGNYHLTVDNPQRDNDKEVLNKIRELKHFF